MLDFTLDDVVLRHFESEEKGDLVKLRSLVEETLSEPYTTMTYRGFYLQNPTLTLFAEVHGETVGVIVAKIGDGSDMVLLESTPAQQEKHGIIAMLAVRSECRRKGLARHLVQEVVRRACAMGARRVVLETEETNVAALTLYGRLGFVRTAYLRRHYLNGVSAFRLERFLPDPDWTYQPETRSQQTSEEVELKQTEQKDSSRGRKKNTRGHKGRKKRGNRKGRR
ncbi:MAG: hypothetical protein MHM6MM_001869 [Cercozoa sp. M6MM]